MIFITACLCPLCRLDMDQATRGPAMKKFVALALLGFVLGTGTVATIIIPAAAAFADCNDSN